VRADFVKVEIRDSRLEIRKKGRISGRRSHAF